MTILGRAGDRQSAQLHLDAADTIADHATLTLNGKGYNPLTAARIELASGVTGTIGGVVIDNVYQPSGE